jgi:RNA polymerase sigma-70 factor (ECF subfamily)
VVERDLLVRGLLRVSLEVGGVVVVHDYLDLSVSVVAETLGVPEGSIRSRLHYAMRGLRAALDADARPTSREGAQ